MKVLQINSVCGVGSTGRIATDIHKVLIQKGHESWIAYGRGEALNCDNTIRVGTKLDNYNHVALTRITDQHGFGSIRATRDFLKKVDQLNPDIIHLHNLHGYYINIELLFEYLKRANKKVIWTLHDCWAFTGHCTNFDYIECEKWKSGCESCPQKRQYPESIIIDNSNKNYKNKKEILLGVKDLTIVTPSKWLSELVKQSFLKEYNCIVINNGIDLSVFKPTPSKFREKYQLENKFIILGVANIWNERKGLDFFNKLAEKLSNDEVIVLVGVDMKQKQKLSNKIVSITRTNNVDELAYIYSAADIFLNPTLEDNFPTTNIESLACGTPVITFDTGGSGESINSNTGFVVMKDSLEKVFEKIKFIKKRGKDYYSNECNKAAVSRYDKYLCFNKYVQLYNNL